MTPSLSLIMTIAVAAVVSVTRSSSSVDAAGPLPRGVHSNSPLRGSFRLYLDADPSMCLVAEGNSAAGTVNGKSPIFWSCADSPGDNAIWEYDLVTGHLVTRANRNQCLGARGNNNGGTNSGNSPIFWSCAGSPGSNAIWELDLVTGRVFTDEKRTQCLGGRGAGTQGVVNGANPIFWACSNTGSNSAWNVEILD
ncbi:hypothetical protein DFQ27_004756 [Actinomortierella ambigua]|uniref:Ricin B lectin domain-containing protein n=1 Tax=Actinomortierella ambigua TaxID=1343610 RepID=A0A9P6Q302_9FUNG|nr:hypothetical protein DFQ27_004756 [Actinomortierella ambigua]